MLGISLPDDCESAEVVATLCEPSHSLGPELQTFLGVVDVRHYVSDLHAKPRSLVARSLEGIGCRSCLCRHRLVDLDSVEAGEKPRRRSFIPRQVGSTAVADDNRTTILNLAVAAIDSGGEAALRVADIAKDAGITVPVLYHYFGSRDGLVVAAQVERYTKQTRADINAIGRAVASCESSEKLRRALVTTWERSLAQRGESRWRRTNVVGSAYARPELEAAIARAQDEIVAALVAIFEPCRQRGWLRDDIDLISTVAWHHSVLIGRVFIEHGTLMVNSAEWDRLTLDALEHAFFGA